MKRFSDYLKEDGVATMNVGSGDVSLPADASYAKKRKRKPLTRNYIEVNGKIKKRWS